jgi:hypothetical protein
MGLQNAGARNYLGTGQTQSGFAIGTILLAVVLIGAIVSAIAIASRGSSNDANLEKRRLDYLLARQQLTDLQMNFERFIATGANPADLIANIYDADGNPTPCSSQPNCIGNFPFPKAFLAEPSGATAGSVIRPVWHIQHFVRINTDPSGNTKTVVYSEDLTLEACVYINQQLNGGGADYIEFDPPVVGTSFTSFTGFNQGDPVQVAPATPQDRQRLIMTRLEFFGEGWINQGMLDARSWTAGCYRQGAFNGWSPYGQDIEDPIYRFVGILN